MIKKMKGLWIKIMRYEKVSRCEMEVFGVGFLGRIGGGVC